MASTLDPGNPFVDWLAEELAARSWSKADLARAMNTHQSVLTKLLNRESALGPDLAKRIAAALGMPQRVVFIKAGLIDDEVDEDEREEVAFKEAKRILSRMSPERRAEAIRLLKAYQRMD